MGRDHKNPEIVENVDLHLIPPTRLICMKPVYVIRFPDVPGPTKSLKTWPKNLINVSLREGGGSRLSSHPKEASVGGWSGDGEVDGWPGSVGVGAEVGGAEDGVGAALLVAERGKVEEGETQWLHLQPDHPRHRRPATVAHLDQTSCLQ